MSRTLLLLVILCCSGTPSLGQSAQSPDLFAQLKKQDSIFFERSFNQCDIAYLDKTTHPELVFFHDQGGIQHKVEFLKAVRENICANPNQKPIRKVEENSLEVFPLYNNGKLYGAIQHGVHYFYIREPNKPDRHTSTAKFTHVWLLDNGNWLLKEVLSYDHRSPGD